MFAVEQSKACKRVQDSQVRSNPPINGLFSQASTLTQPMQCNMKAWFGKGLGKRKSASKADHPVDVFMVCSLNRPLESVN